LAYVNRHFILEDFKKYTLCQNDFGVIIITQCVKLEVENFDIKFERIKNV